MYNKNNSEDPRKSLRHKGNVESRTNNITGKLQQHHICVLSCIYLTSHLRVFTTNKPTKKELILSASSVGDSLNKVSENTERSSTGNQNKSGWYAFKTNLSRRWRR
jgi:hypothetical protein